MNFVVSMKSKVIRRSLQYRRFLTQVRIGESYLAASSRRRTVQEPCSEGEIKKKQPNGCRSIRHCIYNPSSSEVCCSRPCIAMKDNPDTYRSPGRQQCNCTGMSKMLSRRLGFALGYGPESRSESSQVTAPAIGGPSAAPPLGRALGPAAAPGRRRWWARRVTVKRRVTEGPEPVPASVVRLMLDGWQPPAAALHQVLG
jgi:hypothetical protein